MNLRSIASEFTARGSSLLSWSAKTKFSSLELTALCKSVKVQYLSILVPFMRTWIWVIIKTKYLTKVQFNSKIGKNVR